MLLKMVNAALIGVKRPTVLPRNGSFGGQLQHSSQPAKRLQAFSASSSHCYSRSRRCGLSAYGSAGFLSFKKGTHDIEQAFQRCQDGPLPLHRAEGVVDELGASHNGEHADQIHCCASQPNRGSCQLDLLCKSPGAISCSKLEESE